ncbi:uncharacterized protein LOC141586929 isoform X2 [Silene latifolia]|uniref:uncharacterized protein LOC141586929 isoform X2 n=1 Tax=Silene latifolia TaxID=37657 RepID=UPI003D77AD11
MDFHGLNRKKLQELCKKHGIPANLKNVEMADRLSSLLLKEEMPEKPAPKRGRSCLKNVSEDLEVVECEKVGVGSKEAKKVRFSPENQTFLFERTDPRAVRLLGRKKRAFVNSRQNKDTTVVSVNLEESERLAVVSDDVGPVVEPVGRRNLRRRSVVISEDVSLVTGNDEGVTKLDVKGGDLGRSLRSRRGGAVLETRESIQTMSKEENVVKGRNLRRSSRRSLVQAKDLDLESENVDDGEKPPTKDANLELNLRSRRSKMKQDDVEVISLLSPCRADNVNKPETVDHVEKLPTKEDNLELNLRSRRCKMKQDDVEIVSLLSPCGGDNVNKAVEGRNPKRSLRSRGGIEKENGVGGASLLSPCVEKKAKRGSKGKGIAEQGGSKEADRPQNEMVNHGGNIGRVTRKQLRNVDVVAVNLGRDDDCVAEVSGLKNLKQRGQPRKSVRLAEHSPVMILEPLENKGIKRGRRKTLMVKQHDINEGRDVVVEKLGEGNNMNRNGSRGSAKKSRKDVKDGSVEELGDIRRSSRRAAKTKVDISVAHQTLDHDERMDHMIEDDSLMPPQLESRNPEVTEQYKATEEINVQLPINDETTSSLLRNNGDDEANMGHECPSLVVATEEVNVQIPINSIGGDGTRESAKRSRRNDKSGSVEGLDYIRRSGRRAVKNTVDISWNHQTMLRVERIDHMIENDSQMVAQIGSKSPEGNEEYQATVAVNVQMPVNDDSTTPLSQNRDDDEANKARDCPELVVATDYDSEDKNASPCSMTAQICDAIEANHSDEEQTTRSSNELESGMVATETLESSLALEVYGPSNEEKWPEKSSTPSKKDETTFQDVNEKPDVIPGDSTPAGNASDDRNPNTEEQYQATEAVNVHMPVNDDSTTALLQNRDDDEANKAQDCPELVVATDYDSEDKNASHCSMTAQICDAIEANHSGEEQTTRSSNELESGMVASETLESSLVPEFYGPSNEEKWPEKSPSPSKKDETDFQDVNEKPDALETDRIAGNDIVAGDSTPAANASDYRNSNTEGQTHENKSSVLKEQKVENLREAQHNPMQLVSKNTETNSQDVGHSSYHSTTRMHNVFDGAPNQVQEIPFPLNGAFDCSFEDEKASVAHDAVKGTIDDTSFSSVAAENCVGTSEPRCSSAIQPTLLRSRQSVCVHEDANIMRNCEDFESNGIPEQHDNEVNEHRKEEEEFEELSSPCKDNSMGSEMLEDSAIFVDNLAVQLTEPSKVCGTTGACKSISVHEQPSSSRTDTNKMRNNEEFESNGVPELHDYEINEQSREDEGFEELATPCKNIAVGSELLEASEIIVNKLGVQLTEQSKASGSTGVCNSICVHDEQPSSSRSDTKIIKRSKDFESNGFTKLNDYETNEQAVDEGFEELSSPCKDNAIGSELLEVSAVIGDKFDDQLTEQSKVSGSTGVSNSIFKEADQTISEISAAEVERREERCNDTSGGKLSCSANVSKTDHFVEFDKTTLEPSEQVKDTQPSVLENDFNNTTEASGFTAASFGSESMQPNIDEHYGATRDNFYVEQKPERFSDAVAFSPSSSEQLPVTHNTMQVEDYSSGESGVKKAHENAAQYVQALANAAAAAVPLYQSPQPCASLRSSEAQYDNSTSEQLELADNSKDFEYSLRHLFSEADILNTNEIKGLGSITDEDEDEEDLKETRSVSQVIMFKVDSSLRGEVADDIEGPSRDEMDMDDEDLETHSVSQVKGSKADSSLRKLVTNDIEGPSTADMDVDNNQKSVPSLNEDSETKTCCTGKSNAILAASVSMELLKEENIEEATQISPSTLQLNMEYSMRLSEECDGEKESEMNSLTLTNLGGSSPSLIQMTDRCTEVEEEHVSTPPIIVQGTLNDNFEINVGLAKSPENENEIGYNMAGSNVGLTEQKEVDSSRWKSDIIYKECDDGQWPTEFTSDEKLDVGGEASVKGRVQSPSIMGESTPKLSPATLWKLMEDAKEVVTVTRSRLQDGVSDGRSKKRKSESDISVQTSSSYLKTRVIGEPTVFSGSMEKGEECCKESPIGDIACSGNTKKVDYSKFIQKSPNEDANNLVFEDDLMNFDKEKDLESDKIASVTECDDGHYALLKDGKLNESPSEEANSLVFKDDLMNLENERDMDSDKTPRVIEGNDDGHYISSQDKKLNESSHQDANNLVFEDDLMNIDKETDLESDKTLRGIEGNDEGHHVFSQNKKSNESASEGANNLVFEDDLMNFDNERDLESDKTSRVTEGNDEEHHVSSQDNTLNESANENANSVVFEDDLMNLDKESDLECDKISRVTDGNDEDHVSSQDNKSNESANEAANDLVFEDDFVNFDKERDLESDKTLKVAEGDHVSPQDKKSNECANEDANNLVFEDDLMSFDKERDLESDKPSRVTEGNDGGHYVISQEKKSDELQFHHCSNSSSADLSSFIMGLMEKDMSEMFQAEESSPFLSHDETNHKLDDLFSNQLPHESDSRPEQDGNIVMSEAEELVAWNSAMQMHHETTSEASYPTDDVNTGQNQLKFSSGKDIHANCVVDVTEINEDDNVAKEGLCPLSDSEKKTGEMDELFEVDPEVKSLPSSNSLCVTEDTNHLIGCKQVEDTAALEDGSGGKLCAEAGSYITGSMMAQQNVLEEQVDYRGDPFQDDACEISTPQSASKCPENSDSLPHDIQETSGFDDDTRDEKSFNSEACIQLKGDEGIHVNFTAEDAAITAHKLLAMEGMENSSISLSVEGRDGMESPLPQIKQGENTSLDSHRGSELDATDDKMMLKRRNRSVLIHGTTRKPQHPTTDMKENMAAPKRMQMVNATATKPMLKRKALEKICK